MKKCWLVILSMILLFAFVGCSTNSVPDETTGTSDDPIELWIVTEETRWDCMNGVTKKLITQFKKNNPNVKTRLDILPTDPEEREIYLQQLRVQIMSGNGPDVFLLPTDEELNNRTSYRNADVTVEKLFLDEYLTMYNGHFTDISEYYDADEALRKEELVTAVMDAGVLDGARYILPLWYDYPVIYAATDRLDSPETDLDVLKSGVITDIMDLAIETENGLLADGVYTTYIHKIRPCDYLIHFPQFLDYETGKVTLTVDEVAEMLERIRKTTSLSKNRYKISLGTWPSNLSSLDELYVRDNWSLASSPNVLMAGYLHNVVEVAAVAYAEGYDVTMIPVRNASGELVASVSYYGAVGSGCEYPELAYEFLRMFLMEETQWELNRPRENPRKPMVSTDGSDSYIVKGFPVRSNCEVENLWKTYFSNVSPKKIDFIGYYRIYFNTIDNARPRFSRMIGAELTEEDLAILDIPIDRVVFDQTFGIDLSGYITRGGDLDELAKELIRELEMHIAEG